MLEGRAVVTQDGFLTVQGGGEAGVLQLYSVTGEYSSTIMFGAALYDVAPLSTTPPSSLILAGENGRLVLYRYRGTTRTPTTDAELIWSGSLPGPGRLLGALRDSSGAPKLHGIIGDSGCVVLNDTGRLRWSRRSAVIDAMVVDNGYTLLLLERDDAILTLRLLDASSGREQNRVDVNVAASGVVVASLLRTDRPLVAVAGTQPRDTALAVDALTLAGRGGIALHGLPIGVVAGERNGVSTPLCITATAEGVRGIWIEEGDEHAAEPVEWPFETPALHALEFDGAIAIVAHDSAALYDRTLSPLGAIAAPHGLTRIERLANGQLLLVGRERSAIVSLPIPPTWLERYWPRVVVGTILLLTLGIVVAAIRRDRHTRTLHDNLVRLPDAFGVMTVDGRRRIRSINATARRLLGAPEGMPLGKDIRSAIGDEFAPILLPRLRTLIEEGTPFIERFEIEKTEPLVVMVRGRALVRRGGGTAGVLLLVEDVTESVRRENLVNWASVAHHIAHEMKTPLGAVALTAETLHERLRETGIEGDMLRATRRILRQAGRLRSIVSDLLTIARADSLRPVDADLALLLGSIVDELGESIPPSVTVSLRTEGANFRLPLDVEQMTSALRNLLDNAWQAIGPRDDGHVDLVLSDEGSYLQLVVADNGVGMTQETQANLFRPFYTLKHGGSGIGTVIIKRVIEGHGGTISVQSAPGQGTRFIVTLRRKE